MTEADLSALIDPMVTEELHRLAIAGAVVVIVKDDAVVFSRGYGLADVQRGRAVSPGETLMHPGSISKLFTAIGVMQLVEEGKLDLDRDVNAYLDFVVPVPPGGVPVTLRMLLTHRAGFEEHVKNIFLSGQSPPPLGRWLERSQPPRLFPRGDVPAYSNYGVSLAGYVVERVAGMPYADYVRTRILAPLEMRHSTFEQPIPGALAPLMARGYRRADEPPLPFTETTATSPAGALATTGADMGRFLRAILGGGALDGVRVLRAESLARLMGPEIETRAGRMGLVFFESVFEGRRLVGHDGGTLTFFSQLLLSPENRVGLFTCYDGAGAPRIMGEVPRAVVQRYLPTSPEVSPAARADGASVVDVAEISGDYQPSRRADSTFVRSMALLSQVSFRAGRDGNLREVNGAWPFGAGTALESLGERRFRVAPKGQPFSFEPRVGRAMRLDSGPPAQEWQRVPWYGSGRVVLPAVILAFLAAAAHTLLWPFAAAFGFWRRRSQRPHGGGLPGPGPRTARPRGATLLRAVLAIQLVALAAAGALFVAAQSFHVLLTDALDPGVIALYAVAWLGVLGGAAGIPIALGAWLGRAGAVRHRLNVTWQAAVAITLAWFLFAWRIAGITLNG
jgi:CubicO group peptidase (beta-lactamase class C family)